MCGVRYVMLTVALTSCDYNFDFLISNLIVYRFHLQLSLELLSERTHVLTLC